MSENKDICSPVHLTLLHETEDFHSGEETPDTWLRERAFANMEALASRTYVICPSGSRKVIGSMRRNMLRQIPAVILGRLAIDRKWQDQRLGKALLQE